MEAGERTRKVKHPFTGKEMLTRAPIPPQDAVAETPEAAPSNRPLFGFPKKRKEPEAPPPLYKQKFITFATADIDYGRFPALPAAALGRADEDVLALQFDKPALISPRQGGEELYEVDKEFVRKAAELTDGVRMEWIEKWGKLSAEADCRISAADAGYALEQLVNLAREAESLGESMYYYCLCRPPCEPARASDRLRTQAASAASWSAGRLFGPLVVEILRIFPGGIIMDETHSAIPVQFFAICGVCVLMAMVLIAGAIRVIPEGNASGSTGWDGTSGRRDRALSY
jgi:hypothetical protein